METGSRALIGWGTVAAAPFLLALLCAQFESLPFVPLEWSGLPALLVLCLIGAAASVVVLRLRRNRLRLAGEEVPLIDYPFGLWLAFVALCVAACVLLLAAVAGFLLKLPVATVLGRAGCTAILLYFFIYTIGRVAVTAATLIRDHRGA
jgi:hypothetical protein